MSPPKAAPAPKQEPPQRAKRMTLDSIGVSKERLPVRTTLYAVEGIGKTTFGASAPSPIFIGAEDGFGEVDPQRFPQPESFEDVRDAVASLRNGEHDYRTVVLDTLDWIEPMIWEFVRIRDNKKDIEDYGYGKGYITALDQWRVLLNDLDQLRLRRKMGVVLLAHCWIKTFKNPEGEDYDRYEMKIHNKAAGLVKEWSDVVLFANHETFAHKDARKRVRGVSTGARLCFTQRTAAYDAKTRFTLPEQFPLDWGEYESALSGAGSADGLEALTDEIRRKAALVGGDIEEKAVIYMEANRSERAKLELLNNRLNARLAETRTESEVA